MKFNLKNRPHLRKDDAMTLNEWFEGFEKELRHELKKAEKIRGYRYWSIELIKEILGE